MEGRSRLVLVCVDIAVVAQIHLFYHARCSFYAAAVSPVAAGAAKP